MLQKMRFQDHARTAAVVLSSLVVLAACKKSQSEATAGPATSVTATTTGARAASTATGSASVASPRAPSTQARAPAPHAPTVRLSPEERRVLRTKLAEGRALGKAGKWGEAVKTFESVPERTRDGALLSELCYAAYKDGQFQKADDTCTTARGVVHDANLRAQLLFNSGLVREAQGEWAKASRLHAESLSLRPNATVAKHLDEAKKKAAGAAPKEDCTRPFASITDACVCLRQRRFDWILPFLQPDATKVVCEEQTTPTSVNARSVILTADDPKDASNDMKFLFVKDGPMWRRMPPENGNYEPGAMGIHNTAAFEKLEEKTVAGNAWLLAYATYDFNDYNLGGIELYRSSGRQVTPCRLGPKPRCGTTVVLSDESSLSHDDNGDDTSPEARAELAEMKKLDYNRRYETELVLGDDGDSYTVTLKSGDVKLVPSDLIGKHKL